MTVAEYVTDLPEAGSKTFKSKETRDAVAKELRRKGFHVRRSSMRNQLLHPKYLDDEDEALRSDAGFGNTLYKTAYDAIYKVGWHEEGEDRRGCKACRAFKRQHRTLGDADEWRIGLKSGQGVYVLAEDFAEALRIALRDNQPEDLESIVLWKLLRGPRTSREALRVVDTQRHAPNANDVMLRVARETAKETIRKIGGKVD